ncbi:MAG: hypothetical protein WDO69_07120 [Pseudomonadota bacterium]
MPEDDVGGRPSPVSVVPPGAPSVVPSAPPTAPPRPFATLPAPPPAKCEALFELFRGGAGSVHLGRLHSGKQATQLVAMRRLANLPTRELESAMTLAQGIAHPRLTKILGTYQHEDAWYVASEYASGVTLFELGQAAVRQRMPLAAPVAVRIVLDALTVTAEAEQLLGDRLGAVRCVYPESIWISDSGKLFLSELLVAPVLARTTTGASYVAVTAGMSAPASDVRAAAVELARLACARLMNGNPASWQTRELPSELSELLARAIVGGSGTETPAAFASALSALAPQLIASREAVQAELERVMGPERLRRREQLEALPEQTADSDTTRVFRAAPAAALPDFANAPTTVRPPDLSAARARRSTAPPSKPQAAPIQAASPTPTIPASPLTPAPSVDAADSPISGVWREAHARMGVPGRRRRRSTTGEHEAMTPGPMRAPAPAPVLAPAAPQPVRVPTAAKRMVFAALIVLAVGALLGGAWLVQGSMRSKPGAALHSK